MSFWGRKQVLVTGGAGLIGSYLVEQLAAEGAHIRVIDNLSRGCMDNLASVVDKVDVGVADLRLFPVALDACRGQDVVFHLACPSYGVGYSGARHSKMMGDTILLGTNILDAARNAEVKRVCLVSSSCVYPDYADVPTCESWAEECSPEEANRGYGWGKLLLEQLARYHQRENGMDVRIVRPFNTYGPRVPVFGTSADHVLIAIIYRIVKELQPLVVWGDGTQTRSFMHARDVARVLRRVMEMDKPYPHPINVGSNAELPMSGIAKRLLTLCGHNSHALAFDNTKPVGAHRKAADCSRLYSLLKSSRAEIEQTSITDGLTELCEYVKKQVDLEEH